MGKLTKEPGSLHRETGDALSQLLDIHLASESLASSRILTALLDSEDFRMEFIDSMPSNEGLLMCVLLREREPSPSGHDIEPLSLVR
jgi:hypothetical protein